MRTRMRLERRKRRIYTALLIAMWAIVAIFICCATVYSVDVIHDSMTVADDLGVDDTYTMPEPEGEDPDEDAKIEAALLSEAVCVGDCKITHYAACVECCGKADGITYSGQQLIPYLTVAVDPAVIPLLSDVYIVYDDGTSAWYFATDTGSSVTGNIVDVAVGTYDEAVDLGVRHGTVYYVPREEG